MATDGIKYEKATKEEVIEVVVRDNFVYKELHDTFEDFHLEYKSLAKRYEKQKKKKNEIELKDFGKQDF